VLVMVLRGQRLSLDRDVLFITPNATIYSRKWSNTTRLMQRVKSFVGVSFQKSGVLVLCHIALQRSALARSVNLPEPPMAIAYIRMPGAPHLSEIWVRRLPLACGQQRDIVGYIRMQELALLDVHILAVLNQANRSEQHRQHHCSGRSALTLFALGAA